MRINRVPRERVFCAARRASSGWWNSFGERCFACSRAVEHCQDHSVTESDVGDGRRDKHEQLDVFPGAGAWEMEAGLDWTRLRSGY